MAFLSREFIAVPDDKKDQIVFKWPDHNLRKGTRAIIEPDQMAVFINRGEVIGTLGPGRHAIEADEIQHVRFANEYLKRVTDAQPRVVLQIASAMAWLKKVVAATELDPLKDIPTSDHMRDMAGFSSAEISEVTRMERETLEPLMGPRGGSRDE